MVYQMDELPSNAVPPVMDPTEAIPAVCTATLVAPMASVAAAFVQSPPASPVASAMVDPFATRQTAKLFAAVVVTLDIVAADEVPVFVVPEPGTTPPVPEPVNR